MTGVAVGCQLSFPPSAGFGWEFGLPGWPNSPHYLPAERKQKRQIRGLAQRPLFGDRAVPSSSFFDGGRWPGYVVCDLLFL